MKDEEVFYFLRSLMKKSTVPGSSILEIGI